MTSGERWKRSTTRGHHKPQSVSWKSSQVAFWGLAGCSSPSKTSRAKLARWEVPMLGKSQKSLSRYQSIMAVQAARMSRSCNPRWVIFWLLRRLSSGSPLAARTPPWWRTCAPSAGPTCAKRTPGSRWRALELRWSMLFQSWGWVFKHNITYAMITTAWSVKAGEIYLVIRPESDHYLALSVTLVTPVKWTWFMWPWGMEMPTQNLLRFLLLLMMKLRNVLTTFWRRYGSWSHEVKCLFRQTDRQSTRFVQDFEVGSVEILKL